jgi:hypothetical protein
MVPETSVIFNLTDTTDRPKMFSLAENFLLSIFAVLAPNCPKQSQVFLELYTACIYEANYVFRLQVMKVYIMHCDVIVVSHC